MNGEEKGDSGAEAQASEGNADEGGDPLGPNCYYDKSKSFFDNISCDDTRWVGAALLPPALAADSSCPLSLCSLPGKQPTNPEARASPGQSPSLA